FIMPATHIEYDSIVVEDHATYCIRETPLQIIKNTCKTDWTTLKGRKEIITAKTGYHYKTPMMLHMQRNMFAFPTMSASKFECCWIFLKQHLTIGKETQKGAIIFNNYQKIKLD